MNDADELEAAKADMRRWASLIGEFYSSLHEQLLPDQLVHEIVVNWAYETMRAEDDGDRDD
jgi:hypothetical protein